MMRDSNPDSSDLGEGDHSIIKQEFDTQSTDNSKKYLFFNPDSEIPRLKFYLGIIILSISLFISYKNFIDLASQPIHKDPHLHVLPPEPNIFTPLIFLFFSLFLIVESSRNLSKIDQSMLEKSSFDLIRSHASSRNLLLKSLSHGASVFLMTRSRVLDGIYLGIWVFSFGFCLYVVKNTHSFPVFYQISEKIPMLWCFPILMVPFLWRAFRIAVMGAPAILDRRGIYRVHGVNGYHVVPWSSVAAVRWVRPDLLRIGYIGKASKRMIRFDLPCSIDAAQRSELNDFIRQINPHIEFLRNADKASDPCSTTGES